MTTTPAERPKSPPIPTQALLAKIFHWTNLISLFVMLFSGLQIYRAYLGSWLKS